MSDLMHHYAAFNPHARFTLITPTQSTTLEPTLTSWSKWLPSMPTSAHWYSPERLKSLIAAYLAGDKASMTVREFISLFHGLSSTGKQKAVTDACSLTGARLSDLVEAGDVSSAMVARLLLAMRHEAREVKPKKLGVLGETHVTEYLSARQFAAPNIIWYRKNEGTAHGLPYVLEVALGVYRDEHRGAGRALITGLNFSPVLKVPFNELSSLLGENRVDPFDPVVVLLHLACPRLDFTDRGKSSLALPAGINDALEKSVTAVGKAWKRAKNQADREGRMRERELRELHKPKKHLSIKDAAYQVMEAAYMKASSNGTLPAHARQIMYAARDLVLSLTGGKFYKNSASFTQQDLPNFMADNPKLTSDWDVVFDARGRLIEPHTGTRTDLGTLEVRRYLSTWTSTAASVPRPELAHDYPTAGPANRYRYALFIEKEGFYPLLEHAGIAQRFDVAIMSTKGMSVTAARRLVDELSQQGVVILVVRDFDKAGFSIAHSLKSNTRRYQFTSTPKVKDLGLRLADVREMSLQSEPVEYDGKDPRIILRKRGATLEECDFLVTGQTYSGKWKGQRVELNAMTSQQFISWLEAKLTTAGVRKLTPSPEVLKQAYQRAWKVATIQRAIDEAVKGLTEAVAAPDDLQARVGKLIEGTSKPWDEGVWELARMEAQS